MAAQKHTNNTKTLAHTRVTDRLIHRRTTKTPKTPIFIFPEKQSIKQTKQITVITDIIVAQHTEIERDERENEGLREGFTS